MTARRAALLAMILVALAACGTDPPPDSGYVRERRFVPAHWEDGYRTEYRTEVRCGPTIGYDGKTTHTCRTESVPHQVYEAQHEWHPDRWSLLLEDCAPPDEDGKRKCRRGWRSVTEAEYDRYAVGNHYPDPR